MVVSFGEVQFALQSMQLGLVKTLIVLLDDNQPFLQCLVRVLEAPCLCGGWQSALKQI